MKMTRQEKARWILNHGNKFPYSRVGLRADRDAAHRAVLGILADLSDRRGIKSELAAVGAQTRGEIVRDLAEIVREAFKGEPA